MRVTLIGGILVLAISLIGVASSATGVRRFLDGAQPVRGRVVAVEYGGRSRSSFMTVEIAAPSPFAGTHQPRVGLFTPAPGSEVALLARQAPDSARPDVRSALWWELWQATLLWAGGALIGLITLLEGLRAARRGSPARGSSCEAR